MSVYEVTVHPEPGQLVTVGMPGWGACKTCGQQARREVISDPDPDHQLWMSPHGQMFVRTSGGIGQGDLLPFRWVHARDDSEICRDWVGAVLEEVEKALRRASVSHGAPGAPVVVSLRWSPGA